MKTIKTDSTPNKKVAVSLSCSFPKLLYFKKKSQKSHKKH